MLDLQLIIKKYYLKKNRIVVMLVQLFNADINFYFILSKLYSSPNFAKFIEKCMFHQIYHEQGKLHS